MRLGAEWLVGDGGSSITQQDDSATRGMNVALKILVPSRALAPPDSLFPLHPFPPGWFRRTWTSCLNSVQPLEIKNPERLFKEGEKYSAWQERTHRGGLAKPTCQSDLWLHGWI